MLGLNSRFSGDLSSATPGRVSDGGSVSGTLLSGVSCDCVRSLVGDNQLFTIGTSSSSTLPILPFFRRFPSSSGDVSISGRGLLRTRRPRTSCVLGSELLMSPQSSVVASNLFLPRFSRGGKLYFGVSADATPIATAAFAQGNEMRRFKCSGHKRLVLCRYQDKVFFCSD